MGGGMRQVGILAAAGTYALDHHILRLHEDHRRAKVIEAALLRTNYVASVIPVSTNIIIFNLIPELSPQSFIDQLRAHGINASAFGKQSVRFVTHLDIDDVMIEEVCEVLEKKIKY
jgi:threonine aldolase